MTNHADSEDMLADQQKIEKRTEFKYLGQNTHLKDTTKEEIYAGIRAAWSCFAKTTNQKTTTTKTQKTATTTTKPKPKKKKKKNPQGNTPR